MVLITKGIPLLTHFEYHLVWKVIERAERGAGVVTAASPRHGARRLADLRVLSQKGVRSAERGRGTRGAEPRYTHSNQSRVNIKKKKYHKDDIGADFYAIKLKGKSLTHPCRSRPTK